MKFEKATVEYVILNALDVVTASNELPEECGDRA